MKTQILLAPREEDDQTGGTTSTDVLRRIDKAHLTSSPDSPQSRLKEVIRMVGLERLNFCPPAFTTEPLALARARWLKANGIDLGKENLTTQRHIKIMFLGDHIQEATRAAAAKSLASGDGRDRAAATTREVWSDSDFLTIAPKVKANEATLEKARLLLARKHEIVPRVSAESYLTLPDNKGTIKLLVTDEGNGSFSGEMKYLTKDGTENGSEEFVALNNERVAQAIISFCKNLN